MTIEDLYDYILLETGQFLYHTIPTQVHGEAVHEASSSLSVGEYHYKITALSQVGETLPSAEIVVSVESGFNAVLLRWKRVPGATGYRIYGRDSDFTVYWEAIGDVNQWVDVGASGSQGRLPVINTSELGLELSLNEFEKIVERSLEEYGSYSLDVRTLRIYSPTSDYEFSSPIPRRILNVEYDYGSTSYNPLFPKMGKLELSDWDYQPPVLKLPSSGHFRVSAGFQKTLEDITFRDKLFLKLLMKNFLYALARARRSMRMTEIPIEYDADALIEEARSIEESLRESAPAKFWRIYASSY